MAAPNAAQLNQKIDDLQAALDSEQQAIKDLLAEKDATNASLTESVNTLTEANTALQALVEEGGTPEERQAISDKIDGVIADIKSTVEPTT